MTYFLTPSAILDSAGGEVLQAVSEYPIRRYRLVFQVLFHSTTLPAIVKVGVEVEGGRNQILPYELELYFKIFDK